LFQDVENYIEGTKTLENWSEWFGKEIACNILGLGLNMIPDRDRGEFRLGEKLDVSVAMLRRRTR
jgi:hypothetical protein